MGKTALTFGGNINLGRKYENISLYTAFKLVHDNFIQPLVTNGADTNSRLNDGFNPLFVDFITDLKAQSRFYGLLVQKITRKWTLDSFLYKQLVNIDITLSLKKIINKWCKHKCMYEWLTHFCIFRLFKSTRQHSATFYWTMAHNIMIVVMLDAFLLL